MEYPYPIEELEKKTGHIYKDRGLLKTALTHSSFSNENRGHGTMCECNERLEFLGDSVLSIIVSRYIFENIDVAEGTLTKIRAAVVCEKALAKFANDIGLGSYLRLGHGEEKNGGRENPSILADAFEALLGSIYVDSGDKKRSEAEKFLLPFIIPAIDSLDMKGSLFDYKTALQQIVQQADGETLDYFLISSEGPDHNKTFFVEARLNSNIIGRGRGHSKREAEQNAAKEALKLFGAEK